MAVGKVEHDSGLLKLRCKKYEIRPLFSLTIDDLSGGISILRFFISSRQINSKLNFGLFISTTLFLTLNVPIPDKVKKLS